MSFIELGKKKILSLKSATEKTPEEFLGSCFKCFDKDAGRILAVTLVTCFVSFFYLMINVYGCPDSLSEGVYYYRNADFATSLARWFVRYLNEAVGRNLVIPAIIIPLYSLAIGFSDYLLCKMFNIRSAVSQVLLTALTVSFPVVLHHFAYPYIAFSFSFSYLMTVIGTKFIREKKIVGFIVGIVAYLLMLGSYQSYIASISALAFIALIWDMCNMEKVSESLLRFFKVAVAGLIACLIDMPLSAYMASKAIGLGDRASFSLKTMLDNLGFSTEYGYKWFFSFFYGAEVLARKKLYIVFTVILAVMVVLLAIKLIRNRKYVNAAVMLLTVYLLPLAMNLCLIVFPTNGMRDTLRYQYVLVFVMVLFMFESEGSKIYNNLLRYVSYVCILGLVAGNVISANATAYMYKISYEYSINQGRIMVSRLYDLEGYEPNNTPVVMSGVIDISHLVDRYPMIFKLSENEGGPVFWLNYFSVSTCRYHFFYDYLGMDFKEYPQSEYYRIVDSDEFSKMAVWPAEGSVAMIGDYAVIKMGENPIR